MKAPVRPSLLYAPCSSPVISLTFEDFDHATLVEKTPGHPGKYDAELYFMVHVCMLMGYGVSFCLGMNSVNKGYLATNQYLVIRGTYFYPGSSRVIHFNLIF